MLKYTLKKLNNNLTVLIINTPKLSSLDITLYVKIGSIYENKKNNGISHLLEHLLFLNTKKIELDPINLEVYAFTKKNFSHFEITTHKNFIKDALIALSSTVNSPKFTKENLSTIKKIVTEEIIDSSNDSDIFFNQKIDEFLYKNNSLSLNIAGTKESIKNITISDLRKWYKNFYRPDNMILTIVGNIEPKKTIKQIENIFLFNNLTKGNIQETEKINYPNLKQEKIKNNRFQRPYLSFVFPAVEYNHPQYLHYLVLAEILYKKIRQSFENSGLIYDIQLYYQPQLNNGEYRIITTCQKNNINKIIKKFNSFLDSMEISNLFFTKTKNYIKHSFLLKEDYVDELSSLSLYLFNKPNKLVSLKDEIDKIDNIKLNDITQIKEEKINKENCYYFTMN